MSKGNILDSWISKPNKLFYLFGGVTLICSLAAVWMDFLGLAFLPIGFLVAYLSLTNYRLLYNLLFFLIPFSIEVYLPGGLGIDLPTEPIMLLITFIFLLELIQRPQILHNRFFSHPISIILFAHIGWTFFTALTSQSGLISIKFFLAKLWYVIPFYMMASLIINNKKGFQSLLKYLLYGLIGATIYVFIRHMLVGFSFAQVHYIVGPFFRNHVTYGCIICILLPFVWYYWRTRTDGLSAFVWFVIGAFLLLAMYLSFTRATYIAFLASIVCYFIIRLKLMKWSILIGLIAALFMINNMVKDNRYLDFAPDYNKTITHTEFESLIDATAKGEDISTMERVYRWVAGMNMIREKFILGFGPGNFYFFYKSYAEQSFKTYVSDNEDKSGIHSYFLMIFVEQGFPGLVIFILLCITSLLVGEKAYHKLKEKESKLKVMASLLCIIQILIVLIINDLLESDKVGPFFFFCLAIIVLQDIISRKQPADTPKLQ